MIISNLITVFNYAKIEFGNAGEREKRETIYREIKMEVISVFFVKKNK